MKKTLFFDTSKSLGREKKIGSGEENDRGKGRERRKIKLGRETSGNRKEIKLTQTLRRY